MQSTHAAPEYNDIEVPTAYVVVGWKVAAVPLVVGLLLGIPLAMADGFGDIAEVSLSLSPPL